MKSKRTPSVSYELAARAVVAGKGASMSTGSFKRASREGIRHSQLLETRFPAYAERRQTAETSTDLRVPIELHHPKDQVKIRQAAKRMADAEAWVKRMKARSGVPVKTGLREGKWIP